MPAVKLLLAPSATVTGVTASVGASLAAVTSRPFSVKLAGASALLTSVAVNTICGA